MPARLAVDISNDLAFIDPSVEDEFRLQHTESQKALDIQFHYARCLAWVVVGLRMLKDSSVYRDYIGSFIVLLGSITTLIPAFLPSYLNQKLYVKYRPIVVFFDNVLQVVLGCFTHNIIYPESSKSWQEASPFHAIAVLLTGSGTAWLNMSSLLGSLVFRFAMLQQAVLTIIMMIASPEICTRSFSLQRAYMSIHRIITILSKLILPEPMYSAVPFLRIPSSPGSKADALYALQVCQSYQAMNLIVLGMLAPMMYLFWREIKSRERFALLIGGRIPEVRRVVLNPPPSMFQFWGFAAPAVAALLMYVVNFG